MTNGTERLTRIIHWSMAVLVITLITLGFYMKNFEIFEYYRLHKSLGVIAGIAILVRIYWRIKAPWLSSAEGSNSEKLVHYAHYGILVLLLLMPITGIFLSGLGGHGVSLFSLELIPTNYDENGKAIPFNAMLSSFGYTAHELISYALSALLILHIAAALKHHYHNKDDTLIRMLGKQ